MPTSLVWSRVTGEMASRDWRTAAIELNQDEIRVLVALQHRIKSSVEAVPNDPTIDQAVTWIAQLGGYTGKSSGARGSITIARGFEKLLASIEAILAVEISSKIR